MNLIAHRSYLLSVITVVCLLQGCSHNGTTPAAAQKAPAAVDNRVKETDLTLVKLTPEAEQRLGIELAPAAESEVSTVSAIAGEVMLIPGKALIATAPVTGTVHFARPSLGVGQNIRKGDPVFRLTPVVSPQRDLRVTFEADLQSAKARLDTATQQLERARQLLRDLAGSQRNVEAAEQEFGQAKAAYDAAAERRDRLKTHPLEADVDMVIPAPATGVVRQIQAGEEQVVGSGAPLLEVADLSRVWLRVPVYAGDVESLAGQASVRVRDMDGEGPTRRALRVTAPPTADPLAVTTDLYFELANSDGRLAPGQRLTVFLPSRKPSRKGIAVPTAALLYDIYGGTWVYVNSAPHEYRRQRVELLQSEGSSTIIARGLSVGTKVVSAGAAELFGTEFGAGK
jgi:cobalt-zinc-cadmium efflux system membrane fusion protein